MAKTTKPLCKECRKNGIKLYLKGRRCETVKCPVDKREKRTRKFVRRKKISEYGIQLREKNKVKIYYGVLERQFKRYFETAKATPGVTGEILLQFLERRLDNVIFRANWFYSRRMSKQVINHGDILVNGKKVDRPGYMVEIDDEIQLKPNSKYVATAKESMEEYKQHIIPAFLQVDNEQCKIKVLRHPVREEVTLPIEEQLIINLYSK
ncbi:MAG TPA: 30S ribosomal protein S4 [bacterium]|nr:30S ribosomal protein S4 [bacterium]